MNGAGPVSGSVSGPLLYTKIGPQTPHYLHLAGIRSCLHVPGLGSRVSCHPTQQKSDPGAQCHNCSAGIRLPGPMLPLCNQDQAPEPHTTSTWPGLGSRALYYLLLTGLPIQRAEPQPMGFPTDLWGTLQAGGQGTGS